MNPRHDLPLGTQRRSDNQNRRNGSGCALAAVILCLFAACAMLGSFLAESYCAPFMEVLK